MNIGPFQILIIALVILVLFGRGRISEMMGDFGKGVKSFKQGVSEDTTTPIAPPAAPTAAVAPPAVPEPTAVAEPAPIAQPTPVAEAAPTAEPGAVSPPVAPVQKSDN